MSALVLQRSLLRAGAEHFILVLGPIGSVSEIAINILRRKVSPCRDISVTSARFSVSRDEWSGGRCSPFMALECVFALWWAGVSFPPDSLFSYRSRRQKKKKKQQQYFIMPHFCGGLNNTKTSKKWENTHMKGTLCRRATAMRKPASREFSGDCWEKIRSFSVGFSVRSWSRDTSRV